LSGPRAIGLGDDSAGLKIILLPRDYNSRGVAATDGSQAAV